MINISQENKPNFSESVKSLLPRIVPFLSLVLALVMIWQTKSRFAFLAVGFFVAFWLTSFLWQLWLNKFWTTKSSQFWLWMRRFSLFCVLCFPVLVGVVAINLPSETLAKLPVFLGKPSSTFWHGMRTNATLEILGKDGNWLTGFGLGATGPAAKLEYYNIKNERVFRDYETVAYKYRLVGEDLTIPENWFLQVAMNGGIFYLAMYLIVIFWAVFPVFGVIWRPRKLGILEIVGMGFFGIIVGNLFLHIWEVQTVALGWTLIWFLVNLKSLTSEENTGQT